jgi:hypothetical protein
MVKKVEYQLFQNVFVKKITKKIGELAQMTWILFATFILQKPLLIIANWLPSFFDYIFFVYPGTESDMNGVVPKWFAKNPRFRTQICLGGILTKSKTGFSGRGIVVGAPNTVRNMVASKEECILLKERLEKFANCFSINAIAIAGRGPSILLHHNIILDEPFVHGRRGMVFCTIATLEAILKKHQMSLQNTNIVIFGAGDVGNNIANFLIARHCKIKIVSAQSVFDKNKICMANFDIDALRGADIVIVISAKGSDIYPHMKKLKDGAIIIDDTHPRMTRLFKRGYVYRAALTMEGSWFIPRLPVYGSKSIPGCVVEAMVYAIYGQILDQEEFNRVAFKIGLRAYDIK